MQQHEPAMQEAGASPIAIAGVGPVGLSAVITVTRLGRQVCVYERKQDVQLRFRLGVSPPPRWAVVFRRRVTRPGAVWAAMIKQGVGYQVDYNFCKGYGICAQECPCGILR